MTIKRATHRAAIGTVVATCFAAGVLTAPPAHADSDWKLREYEPFDATLDVDSQPWVLDPQGPDSPWHVDHMDDDGELFATLFPRFLGNLATMNVFRKRVEFGKDGWLTAELAAQDKDKDGVPDSEPSLRAVPVMHGGLGALIDEPSHDAGVLIRPTNPLPPQYRVEMTLRSVDFGGMRNGTLEYDGGFNGYNTEECQTAFPWAFRAIAALTRCTWPDITTQNGFFYLAIMDYATPAPHNNVFIHLHRKLVMESFNARGPSSFDNGVCNPATGEIYDYATESTLNGVNAGVFRGDLFREQLSLLGNEIYWQTECGEFSGEQVFDAAGHTDLLSAAELQPELMPHASYTFAIERDATSYTMEMSGPFRFIGDATLRYTHEFVEDGRPVWHFNNTPEQYDGAFNRDLVHALPSGRTYVNEDVWPAGSAYPDSFIIGDPYLNLYEGSAIVDDIKLYVPKD